MIHAESYLLLVATYSQRQGLQSRDTSEPNGASKLLEQSQEDAPSLGCPIALKSQQLSCGGIHIDMQFGGNRLDQFFARMMNRPGYTDTVDNF